MNNVLNYEKDLFERTGGERGPRFSVRISESGAQEYLDGIPLSKEEGRAAWKLYGEPEHDED